MTSVSADLLAAPVAPVESASTATTPDEGFAVAFEDAQKKEATKGDAKKAAEKAAAIAATATAITPTPLPTPNVGTTPAPSVEPVTLNATGEITAAFDPAEAPKTPAKTKTISPQASRELALSDENAAEQAPTDAVSKPGPEVAKNVAKASEPTGETGDEPEARDESNLEDDAPPKSKTVTSATSETAAPRLQQSNHPTATPDVAPPTNDGSAPDAGAAPIVDHRTTSAPSIETPPSNSATPTREATAARGPDLARTLEELRGRLELGHKEIRMRLDPPELGRLDVRLIARGDAVVARLLVERPEMIRAFEKDRAALEKFFVDQGVPLLGLEVRTGGFSRRDAEPDAEGRLTETTPFSAVPARAARTQFRARRTAGALDLLV